MKAKIKIKEINDIEVEIYPDGQVTAYWPGWGMSQSDLNTEIRKAIQEYFEPHQNYYWRATNNQNEIELVKSGEFAKSLNHASGHIEDGLSVSRTLDYLVLDGFDYAYRVKGNKIAGGSDGEPVLDVATLQILDLKPLTRRQALKYDTAYINQIKENVKKAGWTWEQYLEAINNIMAEKG